MGDGKNQHFLPQLLLRRFAENDGRRSVSVLHLQSGRLIPRASIRGQASKANLYDEDRHTERMFSEIETQAGKDFQKLETTQRPPDTWTLETVPKAVYGRATS